MSVYAREKQDGENSALPIIVVDLVATPDYKMVRQDRLIHSLGGGVIFLPDRGAASGLFYCIVSIDGILINITEPETVSVLPLTGANNSVLLFCDGRNWLNITQTIFVGP